MLAKVSKVFLLAALSLGLSSGASRALALQDSAHAIVISVPDQRLIVLENGIRVAEYPVSTSRYGLGDRFGSYTTPAGWMQVAQKIGNGAPQGEVFKNRRATGEVLRPNATGRDPIVTRILWLRGLESGTRNAFARNIYIHGTPVENLIGRPVSYGCIRMRSKDIVELFNRIGVGARVDISNQPARAAVSGVAAFSARSVAAS